VPVLGTEVIRIFEEYLISNKSPRYIHLMINYKIVHIPFGLQYTI
jgi:hypothetical protein